MLHLRPLLLQCLKSNACTALSAEDARLKLTVADNGRGMSLSELEKALCLKPKLSGPGSLSHMGEGMKLGLYHLRNGSESRTYVLCRQGQECTVARLFHDTTNDESCSWVQPIPPGLSEEATLDSLLSLNAKHGRDKTAIREAAYNIFSFPTGEAYDFAGDALAPYARPGDVVKVSMLTLQELSQHGNVYNTCIQDIWHAR